MKIRADNDDVGHFYSLGLFSKLLAVGAVKMQEKNETALKSLDIRSKLPVSVWDLVFSICVNQEK